MASKFVLPMSIFIFIFAHLLPCGFKIYINEVSWNSVQGILLQYTNRLVTIVEKNDFNSTYGSVGFMEHPLLFGTPQEHLQGPY